MSKRYFYIIFDNGSQRANMQQQLANFDDSSLTSWRI